MTANNPYDIHVYFSTINDGWGPIHAKYVGHRPSPRFHSGVLGFTLWEVARSRKVYYVPTSAHMAACAEKACDATRIRACCLHSTCPWRVLAWLFGLLAVADGPSLEQTRTLQRRTWAVQHHMERPGSGTWLPLLRQSREGHLYKI